MLKGFVISLVTLLQVICALHSRAQITLPNPGFENDTIPAYLVDIATGWNSCYQNNFSLLPEPEFLPYYQPPAKEGKIYALFAYSPSDLYRRSISSQFSCSTYSGALHSFSLYLSSFIPPPPPPFQVGDVRRQTKVN